MSMRPKRQYAIRSSARSDKALRSHPRLGWRGCSQFIWLCASFAAPESYGMWRWSVTHDPTVFALLTGSYLVLFGIFCVIARPWERR